MITSDAHPRSGGKLIQGLPSLGMALAAGAVLVLALPPYSILPFALIAFAVLVIMLRGTSWPIAFRLGYLFGLGQFVPGLFWITESFQVEADRFGWLALPAVLGLAALLAVFPAVACALAARMDRAGLPLCFRSQQVGPALNGCAGTF